MYNDDEENYEQHQLFIEKVKMHLDTMSEEKKDAWIISQAKLIKQSQHQDFFESLIGVKKILYMPDAGKIAEFCEKVRSEEIHLEYETHYLEFDDSGRYYGDWEIRYNDPNNAMSFLDCVFRGCHDLILLEDYTTAVNIFNEICCLEFTIIDSPETDDCYPEESGFTIADAYNNNLLYTDRNNVAKDWFNSFYFTNRKLENKKLASNLVELLKSPIFEGTVSSDIFKNMECEELFYEMLQILEDEISKNKERKASCKKYSNEEFCLNKLIDHESKILDVLKGLLTNEMNDKEQNLKASVLDSSWMQIHELIERLSYEPYIDDQSEIEEIWTICAALVKYINKNSEPWSLRKKILQEIIENDYYDYYGCCDPMEDLLKVLCCVEEEYIEMAEIMEQSGKVEKAAKIYYKYGYDQKYIDCLQKRLAKNSNTYMELIDYYSSHDCYEKAVELAWIALEKCKDDLSDVFVFLIKDAYKNGDETSADKLYNRAKRRTKVNINKIDEKLYK